MMTGGEKEKMEKEYSMQRESE